MKRAVIQACWGYKNIPTILILIAHGTSGFKFNSVLCIALKKLWQGRFQKKNVHLVRELFRNGKSWKFLRCLECWLSHVEMQRWAEYRGKCEKFTVHALSHIWELLCHKCNSSVLEDMFAAGRYLGYFHKDHVSKTDFFYLTLPFTSSVSVD